VPKVTDSLYDLLASEEDAGVCTDISEDACRYVPASFVEAPPFVLALLVPLRESGSLIPQLPIAT